jgi:large subunit ribosomal protein L21
MLAVIKTGGKQYPVSVGTKLKIEKLEKKEGTEVTFNEVLLLEKDNEVEIGKPFLKGVKVIGKVLSQGKNKKVIIYHYKAKKREKVKKGHRQSFTQVEITKIETPASA